MNILGISAFFHDSAAAIVRDGKVVFAAEEERFRRNKHCSEFPALAIQAGLGATGLKVEDLDYVAFYEKPLLKLDRILYTHLRLWPRSLRSFLRFLPDWFVHKLFVKSIIRRSLDYHGEVCFVPHHLCHAASAFLVSPFDEAAILTLDAVGEWSSTTRGVGRDRSIELTDEIRFPHSLGLLYSAITEFLGFTVLNGEGKVMGLSSYGRPIYRDKLLELVQVADDGSFKIDLDYFHYQFGSVTGYLRNDRVGELLGMPPRKKDSPMEQRYADVAASLQSVLEIICVRLACDLQQRTSLKNLALAGGVALNSAANDKILRESPFEQLYIQPSPGDGGSAIGAAVYLYHTVLGNPREHVMRTAFIGTEYSDADIEKFLLERNIPHRHIEDQKELLQFVAGVLADNQIVGWMQGPMEFGPRSLGGRSILASPVHPEMKDILNHKVKHREGFRPFAPVIKAENLSDWFDSDQPSPFMLRVAGVKPECREQIPAVTHVDGTSRVQSLERQDHPLFYDLIDEFEKRTGVPMLVNTSFNVRGRPIVESPDDAYQTYVSTRMDHLVLGSYVLSKDPDHELPERPYGWEAD